MGLGTAFRCFWRALTSKEFCEQVGPILDPPPPEPEKPSAEPIRLLTILQREGRLIDFLLEDISAVTNEQIGAAVREIHRDVHQSLLEHLVIEKVIESEEEEMTTVPAGFDPSAIRVTGNVAGEPPFRGILKHHGWRVTEIKLPESPAEQDEFVLMPAEVEIE